MNSAARAPELSDSLQWMNCGRIPLAELQGRIVALVFWHAGGVGSHNLLAELQQLHRRHAEHLTVIGIHTPKFEAERSTTLVAQSINRLELPFPVAQDNDFVSWQHYGVEAWPTVVLLDVAGHRAATYVGDMQLEAIDQAIVALVEAAGFESLRFQSRSVASRPEPGLPLAFPSGIAVGPSQLYIADSGHHRVLECSFDGRVLRQFGSGLPGLVDGRSGEACLQKPRGLHLSRDTLYIADTGNHAIRSVRLFDGQVETIVGNGRPGLLAVDHGRRAEGMSLNAPWALCGSADRLYIAMTGAHQLWELNQADKQMRALAGLGAIGSLDGSLAEASFAQPAGIALLDRTLFVTDAASSLIRSVHLPGGPVYTVAGQGNHEFGLQDGGRASGRLQFPCAVASDVAASQLWIADSYNNALRSLRLAGSELRTCVIDHRLQQPAAIACAGDVMWIANTHAHEIVRCDLTTFAARRLPVGE